MSKPKEVFFVVSVVFGLLGASKWALGIFTVLGLVFLGKHNVFAAATMGVLIGLSILFRIFWQNVRF